MLSYDKTMRAFGIALASITLLLSTTFPLFEIEKGEGAEAIALEVDEDITE
jgi:hypothetical protein